MFRLITGICLLFYLSGLSQSRTSFSAGIGFPEYAFLGLNQQIQQFEVGTSAGIFAYGELSLTWNSYLSFHFADQSKYQKVKPWFISSTLNYIYNRSTSMIWKSWYFGGRVGREMFLSQRSSIKLEAGVVYNFFSKRRDLNSSSSSWFAMDGLDLNLNTLPAIELTYILRLN